MINSKQLDVRTSRQEESGIVLRVLVWLSVGLIEGIQETRLQILIFEKEVQRLGYLASEESKATRVRKEGRSGDFRLRTMVP